MRISLILSGLAVVAALSGCTRTSEPFDGQIAEGSEAKKQILPDIRVTGVAITVPRSLRVSEENLYYPNADIIWRGEPVGDRYAQVEAIFSEAAGRASGAFSGAAPVAASIEVERFHSVTEKARYTVGGIHSITFALTLLDSASGQPIGPRRVIHADLRAYGGQNAVDADARGETQKLRITDHLERVIREELENPEAYFSMPTGNLPASG